METKEAFLGGTGYSGSPVYEDDFSKGVIVRKSSINSFEVDLFIIVAYGIRITEIVGEVQKRVKYDLELKFDIKVKAVNVYVQGIKNI